MEEQAGNCVVTNGIIFSCSLTNTVRITLGFKVSPYAKLESYPNSSESESW